MKPMIPKQYTNNKAYGRNVPCRDVDSSDSDDSQDGARTKIRRDEYGDKFEDYGFYTRAEEMKVTGNEHFSKERYEKAMGEYRKALDQIITLEHDKSIIIGNRKWQDAVVLRSTLHLNISTCHFKMCDWQKSATEALECLNGNIREQMMWADPQIQEKVKAAAKKDGALSVKIGEHRLPKPLRAKAHFRVCQFYTNLEVLDKAKDAMTKAMENCEDNDKFLAEITQYALHLEAREKEVKGKQLKQFAGFFDKLQERGGYIGNGGHEENAQESAPSAPAATDDAAERPVGSAEFGLKFRKRLGGGPLDFGRTVMLAFSSLLVAASLPAFWCHVPEPPNQPPLNATATAFTKFRMEILHTMQESLAATDWKYQEDKGDGIRIGHRMDPDAGCPWVRGEAILTNCSLNRTSDYIIINPRPTEWSPGYNASNFPFRKLNLSNGTQSINWHWEHDSVFLGDRAYWAFTGWQWFAPGAIEDITVAFHGELPPPPNLPTGLRSTEWAMHRLTDVGSGSTKYEVLWFEDLHGIVPCKLTVGSQASALRKEIEVYRRILNATESSKFSLI